MTGIETDIQICISENWIAGWLVYDSKPDGANFDVDL